MGVSRDDMVSGVNWACKFRMAGEAGGLDEASRDRQCHMHDMV
jgi:hypothetical protein